MVFDQSGLFSAACPTTVVLGPSKSINPWPEMYLGCRTIVLELNLGSGSSSGNAGKLTELLKRLLVAGKGSCSGN